MDHRYDDYETTRDSRKGLNPLLPANNIVHSSAVLKMTGIWTKTIGYDPYAQEADRQEKEQAAAASREKAKDILAMVTQSNRGNVARGACKKCGMMGHLTFQCRNFEMHKKESSDDDSDSGSSDDSDDDDDKSRRHDEASKKRKRSSEKKRKSKKDKKDKKAKKKKEKKEKKKKQRRD
ncbi:hypothetical protein LEN26_010286 [Aphanomyces euteiches]|nr:hypothetical protein AeMF1_019716 [Aphanomyces euteiches]KAH9122344.1 hypothetical protein LEN26_010286 [Aphanomyces euteiches]KAH9186195.1 hypothetical protein AeNC1_011826 [Aphanomyces euteiches]